MMRWLRSCLYEITVQLVALLFIRQLLRRLETQRHLEAQRDLARALAGTP